MMDAAVHARTISARAGKCKGNSRRAGRQLTTTRWQRRVRQIFSTDNFMKNFFTALVFVALVAQVRAGDPMVMIKQKAKDIANANNERQGIPPSYPSGNAPAGGAPTMPAAPQLTSEQRALIKLIADLDGSHMTVLTNYADKLWDDLHSVAHAPVKATGATLTKISDQLAAALLGKPACTERLRLGKNLETLLNNPPTSLPADEVAADCVAILKKAGADVKAADAVGTELKAAVAEVRKKAAK
jgi:hypothetical protein